MAPIGKPRRALYPTDNFPDTFSYQVDFYIEIDQALVDHHGDLSTVASYINALVTATSAIYEREIDTHRELFCAQRNRCVAVPPRRRST